MSNWQSLAYSANGGESSEVVQLDATGKYKYKV